MHYPRLQTNLNAPHQPKQERLQTSKLKFETFFFHYYRETKFWTGAFLPMPERNLDMEVLLAICRKWPFWMQTYLQNEIYTQVDQVTWIWDGNHKHNKKTALHNQRTPWLLNVERWLQVKIGLNGTLWMCVGLDSSFQRNGRDRWTTYLYTTLIPWLTPADFITLPFWLWNHPLSKRYHRKVHATIPFLLKKSKLSIYSQWQSNIIAYFHKLSSYEC